MADRFYEKEAKKMKKDKRFKFKFQDLINEVADRAQVLKLQGKNTSKTLTAKVAAVAGGPQGSFRDILKNSPPKQQGPLPVKTAISPVKCRFCQENHQTEVCTKLMSMGLQQRVEALKRGGFCFRCLSRGHMERECTRVQPPICRTCKMGHQSMLHNLGGRAQTRTPQSGNPTPTGAAGAVQGAQSEARNQEETTTA